MAHQITVSASETCEITCDDQVHGKHKEEFEWICDDGDLEISFNKNGSPFANGSLFTARAGRYTRPKAKVKDSGATGTYDYTITVKRPEQTCVQDPQIIIDETNWSDHWHEALLGVTAVVAGAFLLVAGVKKLASLKQASKEIERKL